MHSYHLHFCGWSSSNDQVCPLLSLNWNLSEELQYSFATPAEHGAIRCRQTRSLVRVYGCPCHQLWNYKIHQHTVNGYSPDDESFCKSIPEVHPSRSKVNVGHSLVAFDYLHIRFEPLTLPFRHSPKRKAQSVYGRRDLTNSKHSASDSKQWRP